MNLEKQKRAGFSVIILMVCCSILFSLCCSGCSKEEKKTERYGILYTWKDRRNKSELNIYKEPANQKSGVIGQVKKNELFRILGEKDFYFEIETKDKLRGWFPKSHAAECFYDEDFDKEKKEKSKVKGKPDAVTLFGMSYAEDMGANPKTWYEASPKKDMELRELPFEKSRIIAHAKANHRYLITETADTGYLKDLSRVIFNNGSKAELLLVLGYKTGAFYRDNEVFDFTGKDYFSDWNYEKKDKDNILKGHTYWIRLKTEDGEGWVKPYSGPLNYKDWNGPKRRSGNTKYMDFALYPKLNPIRILANGAIVSEKNAADSDILNISSYFDRRVMVLEEKDGRTKIMSYIDGMKGWVESKYVRTYKEAYKLQDWEVDSEAENEPQKNSTATTKETPAAETQGVITGTEVRIRRGPGLDYKIDGHFEKGETVAVLEEKPKWFKVKRQDGSEGWVSADYLKKK